LLIVLVLAACRPEPPRLVAASGATRVGALEFRAVTELTSREEPLARGFVSGWFSRRLGVDLGEPVSVRRPVLRTRVAVRNVGPDTLYLSYGQCATWLRLFGSADLRGAPIHVLGGARNCLLMRLTTPLAPGATRDALFVEEAPLPGPPDGAAASPLARGTYHVAAEVDVTISRSMEESLAAPDAPAVRVPAGALAVGR
jgi:hypothetical protein